MMAENVNKVQLEKGMKMADKEKRPTEEDTDVNEALGTLIKGALSLAKSPGGRAAIGSIVGRGTNTIRKTIEKMTSDKQHSTGGSFGSEGGDFKTGGQFGKTTTAFKREETENERGQKTQSFVVPKKEVKEGYAGGAQISHSHGNPAPDLTKDTKVTTQHRAGGGSRVSRGTATPPSYGSKARDLTKNSNPQTRHKPLTAGRIREDEEIVEVAGKASRAALDVLRKANAKKDVEKLDRIISSRAKANKDVSKIRIKEGEDMESEGAENKNLRGILESYYGENPVTAPYAPNTASSKMSEFLTHAHEYCYQKSQAEHHQKLAAHHEEENYDETNPSRDVHPLAKGHYHQAEAHHSFAKHHADQLVKNHGVSYKDIGLAHHKHKGNSTHFSTALASSRGKKK